MDYNKLYEQLPKQPVKWNVGDVQVWLRFIGLSSLYAKFKSLAIDGSCISTLTEQDLRDELNIKSGIIVKKIMLWITKGLSEYSQYIGEMQQNSPDVQQSTQKAKLAQAFAQPLKQLSNKSIIPIQASLKQIETNNVEQEADSMINEDDEDKKKEYQLIIQQCDGPQTSFFSVKEEGAKIGRHSSNQILILDEGVSRHHAQIKFDSGVFYIRDTGSTAGTFVKILERKLIYDMMILEMGSNQFQAHLENGMLTLDVIEGPANGATITIPQAGKVTIGRKSNNLLNFPNDQHLSNCHSEILSLNNNYYIADLNTTNGTWERLSREGESSTQFQIYDGTIFKVGTSQTYCCKIKMMLTRQKYHPNACVICCENGKDCVFMPCKHNASCIKCSKNMKECPICRVKIEDYLRIYRS